MYPALVKNENMNVEYTVYEKHYLTASEWKVNHRRGWLAITITGVAGAWSRHILGWCHIHFIKPKTYSALLPPKAYDSPHLWHEFVRVTKHSLRSIFRYYDVCMTHFLCSFKYNDLHFENTTTAKNEHLSKYIPNSMQPCTHLHLVASGSGGEETWGLLRHL